jgi:hypothetical protein
MLLESVAAIWQRFRGCAAGGAVASCSLTLHCNSGWGRLLSLSSSGCTQCGVQGCLGWPRRCRRLLWQRRWCAVGALLRLDGHQELAWLQAQGADRALA